MKKSWSGNITNVVNHKLSGSETFRLFDGTHGCFQSLLYGYVRCQMCYYSRAFELTDQLEIMLGMFYTVNCIHIHCAMITMVRLRLLGTLAGT